MAVIDLVPRPDVGATRGDVVPQLAPVGRLPCTNNLNVPKAKQMPASQVPRAENSFDLWIDRLACFAAVLPVALGIYFFCRILDVKFGALVALLLAFILVFRSAPSSVMPPLQATSGARIWVAFALLVCVALAPQLMIGLQFGAAGILPDFTDPDDSFNFMILQGMQQEFPPVDLSYSGRKMFYHLGGPLLADWVYNLGSPTLALSFYMLVPLAVGFLGICCAYAGLRFLSPSLRPEWRLLVVFAMIGLVVIRPYELIWNLRHLIIGNGFSFSLITQGMPVAEVHQAVPTIGLQHGAPLATLFVLITVVNAARMNWASSGLALFAVFLAKAPIFVAFGAAWGIWAIIRWISARDFRFLGGAALALGLALLARSYILEPGIATVALSPSETLIWRGAHLSRVLGSDSAVVAVAAGFFLSIIGGHVLSVATFYHLKAEFLAPGVTPIRALLVLILITSLGVAGFLSLQSSAELSEAFARTHEPVIDYLWTDSDSYLSRHWKIATDTAWGVFVLSFGMLGLSGASRHLSDSPLPNRQWVRALSRSLILAFATVALVRSLCGAIERYGVPEADSFGARIESIRKALPSDGVVIICNDLAYDRESAAYLPLMNSRLPAMLGVQFWMSNLMFNNNFAAHDALARLELFEDFWKSDFTSADVARLRAAHVSHVLWTRAADRSGTTLERLKNGDDLRPLFTGADYALFEVLN